MYEAVEHLFRAVVRYGILILEIVGACIILFYAIRSLICLLRRQPVCRLVLAEGIATALSFLLGGEALKTIIAPDWMELGMTAAILAMRAAMSVLIHWETHNEEKAE